MTANPASWSQARLRAVVGGGQFRGFIALSSLMLSSTGPGCDAGHPATGAARRWCWSRMGPYSQSASWPSWAGLVRTRRAITGSRPSHGRRRSKSRRCRGVARSPTVTDVRAPGGQPVVPYAAFEVAGHPDQGLGRTALSLDGHHVQIFRSAVGVEPLTSRRGRPAVDMPRTLHQATMPGRRPLLPRSP